MEQEARLDYLIDYLRNENPAVAGQVKWESRENKLALFRALCNVRLPEPAAAEFLEIQDAFLTEWNEERPSIELADLEEFGPHLYLWQGDITRLSVAAIVNAANSELLGCMRENHHCIDNIIHTRAGVQLRLACNDLMSEQGRKEPAGKAKITAGFNLPADYVIHTVGPFIDERGVSPLKERLLAACYRSCLSLADEYGLATIAFCCISTGEFNFPNQHAAEIAVQTVKEYLHATGSQVNVIFNVFKDEDYQIYQTILGKKE